VLTLALVAAPAALTPQQHAEIRRVEDRLLAPCCYSQSVAEHMSPVAEQMRQEITAMVAAGESEPAIIDHYKAMYGERILIIPSGETGRILFTLPALGVVLGAALLFLFLRGALHRKVNAAAASANAAPDRSRQAFREQFDRLDEDI
jgi:cytochrome c-type biogenesis protein CcmH